ncbi:uncharacterized protein LOC143453543 isoform X1 [Clavelina lepadiformis]|uniref:uncharacterized protein LOC143453543 isoform X1 n=1 Tax=Clavelina lepadiformis TaxID=159417 RepID=UPI004041B47C
MQVRITFLLVSFCVGFLPINSLYLCPCIHKSNASNVMCPSYRSKPGCQELKGAPIGLNYWDIEFTVGCVKHSWNGSYDVKAADNLTLYQVTSRNVWIPIKGCVDVPLSQKKCIAKKCYNGQTTDDEYLNVDIRILFHKRMETYEYSQGLYPNCVGMKFAISEPQKTVDLSYGNLTAEELRQNTDSLWYFYFNRSMEEYKGKETISLFNRATYTMPLNYFALKVQDGIRFVLDKTRCEIHETETLNKSDLNFIYDYTFPAKGAVFVCFIWNSFSRKDPALICMKSEPTQKAEETNVHPDGTLEKTIILVIIFAILLVGVVILLTLLKRSEVCEWIKTEKERKAEKKKGYNGVRQLLQRNTPFISPLEIETPPDALSSFLVRGKATGICDNTPTSQGTVQRNQSARSEKVIDQSVDASVVSTKSGEAEVIDQVVTKNKSFYEESSKKTQPAAENIIQKIPSGFLVNDNVCRSGDIFVDTWPSEPADNNHWYLPQKYPFGDVVTTNDSEVGVYVTKTTFITGDMQQEFAY